MTDIFSSFAETPGTQPARRARAHHLSARHAAQAACLVCIALLATPLWAQAAPPEGEPGPPQDEDAREEDMFGASSDEPEVLTQPPQQDPSREDALFGEQADTTPSPRRSILEKIQAADDELALGGLIFMQGTYTIPETYDFDDQRLSAPSLVDLYLDARPNPRVRAFVRGRLTYDYTRPVTRTPTQEVSEAGADESLLSEGLATGTLGGGGRERLSAQLDQLWLKFDIARTLYLTLGRQSLRWGVGRFWNPTDFLNVTRINPIALFDQRLGIDLLKLHVPIETLGWNLYVVGALGEADTLDDLGGAVRAEILVRSTEVALTFAARRQIAQGPSPIPSPLGDGNIYEPEQQWPQAGVPLRFGADVSTGLGNLELRAEAALVKGLVEPFYRGALNLELSSLSFPQDYSRADEWIPQVTASADLTITYGDGDVMILGGEYFYNGQGYAGEELADPNFLLWLGLQGGLRPLYLGRHYGALALLLPSPGSLELSTFTLSTLGNLSDRSFLSRLDYSVSVLTDLSASLFVMHQYGLPGELNYSNTIALPGQEPLTITAPAWSLGGALRMSF